MPLGGARVRPSLCLHAAAQAAVWGCEELAAVQPNMRLVPAFCLSQPPPYAHTPSCTLLLPTQDPFISAALGPNAKLERMRAAALRLGGQGLNATHDDHLLIIGDAAGHIDPLTGACV